MHTGAGRVITTLLGDDTVLCVVVADGDRVAIVLNARYPDALLHAERHLRAQPDTAVWICSPDCPAV
jgi:hypothetical protein